MGLEPEDGEESALIMESRSIRRGMIKAGPLSLSGSFPSDKNINGRLPNKKGLDFDGHKLKKKETAVKLIGYLRSNPSCSDSAK